MSVGSACTERFMGQARDRGYGASECRRRFSFLFCYLQNAFTSLRERYFGICWLDRSKDDSTVARSLPIVACGRNRKGAANRERGMEAKQLQCNISE